MVRGAGVGEGAGVGDGDDDGEVGVSSRMACGIKSSPSLAACHRQCWCPYR